MAKTVCNRPTIWLPGLDPQNELCLQKYSNFWPPLCLQNLFCLSTTLSHFLTPLPLLRERHICSAPLSKSTYQWTRLKRSFEFLLFTQMCFDISLDHAFVRRGSCFTSCFSKTKTRWHDWSQSFSHFLHVLLSLINLVTEALGEFLLLGRWLNTFTFPPLTELV